MGTCGAKREKRYGDMWREKGEEMCSQSFGGKNRGDLEYLDVEGRIILKLISENYRVIGKDGRDLKPL